MPFKVTNYLLIDIDNEFSRSFADHYFNSTQRDSPSTLVIAGSNTRQLVKMMFDELIKDYCYCDLENEISVSELASYLHEHHHIQGVLLNKTDYLLANDTQRFIYNSLHEKRFLVSRNENGFTFTPVPDPGHTNHLSCHTDIAETSQDLTELAEQFNKY
jgi:histone acetyltransferase (RNA polymerase elongator complex component)